MLFWTLQEAIFGAVYTLTQDSILRDWRYAVRPYTASAPSQNDMTLSTNGSAGACSMQIPHMVVEYLQWLILVFGPQWDWNVDWTGSK